MDVMVVIISHVPSICLDEI